jgi:RNA polymerase sigma factor (sigma-70 family)
MPHQTVAGMWEPGAFQCVLLRAFQLPEAYREVFLLKDIQGYSLAEIAAILGISVDTAFARLKRARREVGRPGTSETMERVG